MKHITQLRIHLAGTTVGELGLDSRGRIYFQYDPAWLQTGFDLSPHTLAFHAQTQLSPEPLGWSSSVQKKMHQTWDVSNLPMLAWRH